ADAGFATAEKPSEVWDVVAQKPVAFEYENGWVKIKDIGIEPAGTRIFGVKRADMAGGVDFWWKEKTKFWKSAKVEPFVETANEDSSNPLAISFEAWKFYADKDGAAGKTNDWLKNAFDDGKWRNINNEPWNIKFEDLKDYGGVGLYRSQPFALPSGWKNRKVTLNTDGYTGNCFTSFELYVNGEKIDGVSRPRQADISSKLKKEGNVVCIRLTGRNPSGDNCPLSGLLGCAIWIQPEITLAPSISLLGEWQAVMGDWSSMEKVNIPGADRKLTDDGRLKDGVRAVKANHLVRDVDIPSGWRGKNVYLRLVTPNMQPPVTGLSSGMLMINGQVLLLGQMSNAPLGEMLNLTPHIKFGQKNRIELWPMGPSRGNMMEVPVVINNIEIGCEAE
ncbi:MAG: hypothetical protein WAX69_12140, partial [Victivallales bacterium]